MGEEQKDRKNWLYRKHGYYEPHCSQYMIHDESIMVITI